MYANNTNDKMLENYGSRETSCHAGEFNFCFSLSCYPSKYVPNCSLSGRSVCIRPRREVKDTDEIELIALNLHKPRGSGGRRC